MMTDENLAAHAHDPETHVVSAVGAVGTGKSSLLNALAGERLFETGEAYVCMLDPQHWIKLNWFPLTHTHTHNDRQPLRLSKAQCDHTSMHRGQSIAI